jgi:hypothetical protein
MGRQHICPRTLPSTICCKAGCQRSAPSIAHTASEHPPRRASDGCRRLACPAAAAAVRTAASSAAAADCKSSMHSSRRSASDSFAHSAAQPCTECTQCGTASMQLQARHSLAVVAVVAPKHPCALRKVFTPAESMCAIQDQGTETTGFRPATPAHDAAGWARRCGSGLQGSPASAAPAPAPGCPGRQWQQAAAAALPPLPGRMPCAA